MEFAETVTCREPVALLGEQFTQESPRDTLHSVFEVTLKVSLLFSPRVTELGETLNVGPSDAESPPQLAKNRTAHSPLSTFRIVFFFILFYFKC